MGLFQAETGTRQGHSYTVYLPDSYSEGNTLYAVVFVQDGDRFSKIVEQVFTSLPKEGKTEHIVVGVSSPDRMDAYTPWPAVHLTFSPFGGHGSDYLHFLAEDLRSFLASRYRMRTDKEHTAITGFSLGGLISLYALYTVPVFGQIAAISPSCWYPGWTDFIQKNKPLVPKARVLFVAGRTEGNGKPYPLNQCTQYLEKTRTVLGTRLDQPLEPIVWDDGTHTQYQLDRQQKAFRWLFNNT